MHHNAIQKNTLMVVPFKFATLFLKITTFICIVCQTEHNSRDLELMLLVVEHKTNNVSGLGTLNSYVVLSTKTLS